MNESKRNGDLSGGNREVTTYYCLGEFTSCGSSDFNRLILSNLRIGFQIPIKDLLHYVSHAITVISMQASHRIKASIDYKNYILCELFLRQCYRS